MHEQQEGVLHIVTRHDVANWGCDATWQESAGADLEEVCELGVAVGDVGLLGGQG